MPLSAPNCPISKEHWLSIFGWILNSALQSRLFIYLLVQAVNPLHLESVLAAEGFYLEEKPNPLLFFWFFYDMASIRWRTSRRKYCSTLQMLSSYRSAEEHHLFRKSLRYLQFYCALPWTSQWLREREGLLVWLKIVLLSEHAINCIKGNSLFLPLHFCCILGYLHLIKAWWDSHVVLM